MACVCVCMCVCVCVYVCVYVLVCVDKEDVCISICIYVYICISLVNHLDLLEEEDNQFVYVAEADCVALRRRFDLSALCYRVMPLSEHTAPVVVLEEAAYDHDTHQYVLDTL
jgi:hypothetical protein